MLCVASVLHVSPHGPNFTRVHVVVITRERTANDCVRRVGAEVPPGSGPPCIVPAGTLHRISYGESIPVAHDPGHVIVAIKGIPGGVFVPVPYRCTSQRLMQHVVPDKLRSLGVHAFDVHGAPYVNGKLASVSDFWRADPPVLTWTKLRVPVQHKLAPYVARGIRRVQRAFRERPVVIEYK